MTLDELIAAALAAGAVLPGMQAGIDAAEKQDGSPVTAADNAAEAIILEHLRRAAPDVAVVAEESGDSTGGTPPARFFLVDPLDGTKEFINGRADYTVNIALIEDGEPVAGVVFAPARSEVFAGQRGQGARYARLTRFDMDAYREAAQPAAVRAFDPAAIAAVASRSHRTPETDAVLERIGATDIVSAGSSLKFCLVATGQADFYPRLGRTMEWDTAAGHAVLSAAGGLVTTLEGEPLRYGKVRQADDADYANPFFLAASTPALIARTLG